jgi:hypothetical protein
MDCLSSWAKKVNLAPDGAPARYEEGLQGSLDDGCVLDVMQLLVRTLKTGRLELYPEGTDVRTNAHTVFLRNGNIEHAENALHDGRDALYSALRLTNGEFRFIAGEYGGKATIKGNPHMLLMDACRLWDEEGLRHDSVSGW